MFDGLCSNESTPKLLQGLAIRTEDGMSESGLYPTSYDVFEGLIRFSIVPILHKMFKLWSSGRENRRKIATLSTLV